MPNKKGIGLNALYPVVVTIFLIGLALGVGIYTLDSMKEAISTTDFTVANESIDTFTQAPTTLATTTTCGFNTPVIVRVTNATQVLPTTNYSFDSENGVISYTAGQYNNTAVNVTYTYKAEGTGTSYCDSVSTTSTGIGSMADWIAVIVVVIAAAIVLGIVLSSFVTRRSGV